MKLDKHPDEDKKGGRSRDDEFAEFDHDSIDEEDYEDISESKIY